MKDKPVLPEDAEVHVRHFRIITTAVTCKGGTKIKRELVRYHRTDHEGIVPDPCGGRTVVEIKLDDLTFIGVANCSKKDAFDYNIGRTIAMGRALKNAQEALAL